MSEIREFHIGDILSVATPKLVSPNGIDGVYDLLEYMEGHDHWTHELRAAADRCVPHLQTQFSWLKDVDASEVNTDNWQTWLQARIDEHGEMHPVTPCPHSRTQSPFETLADLRGGKTDGIIGVVVD